jgi:hypothetical protein
LHAAAAGLSALAARETAIAMIEAMTVIWFIRPPFAEYCTIKADGCAPLPRYICIALDSKSGAPLYSEVRK